MIKICSKCWNEKCICGKKEYIKLDEEIALDICKLNKKGYKTMYCCQGHKKDMLFSFYVSFSESVNFDIPTIFKVSSDKKTITYTRWSSEVNEVDIKDVYDTFYNLVSNLPYK